MSPCQKLGYKVGDKFVLLCDNEGFAKGTLVTLYRDDDSHAPLFKGQNSRYTLAGREQGAYSDLRKVRKIYIKNPSKLDLENYTK